MVARFTDEDIDALLQEAKRVPPDYRAVLGRRRPKRGHAEAELIVGRADGGEFSIRVRQSTSDPLDFSVILAVRPVDSYRLFRVRRYNGRHEHTNRIERDRFDACHVHMATQRYQERGFDEDAYAEPSDRFYDVESAIRCLIEDCNVQVPEDMQRTLF